MRYYSVHFEFKTRPLFRPGRWKSESKTFAALDLAGAYQAAKEDAEVRYARRRWTILGISELTVPNAEETSEVTV